ncbi:Protein of unknown function [Pyronema omphalodes CBS 100304]|uniref:Uncharacterized protein n=1 Tax=Pyronema omphalodes (strain CBS 100304) TaxID=1076935 RepID=U4LKD2_PYROM|nr:Protein of unknown function [Pyronema omphalodes CBS 100304]
MQSARDIINPGTAATQERSCLITNPRLLPVCSWSDFQERKPTNKITNPWLLPVTK